MNIMKNKIENALSDFVGLPKEEENKTKVNDTLKKVVLDEREGLIERVDKLYVTSDGRMLLREQY